MTLKATMFFELEGYGWSEVHYVNSSDLSSFIPQDNDWVGGISPASVLFTARRTCLVDAARIVHMRVSNLDLPGVFVGHDYEGDISFGDLEAKAQQQEAETFESLLVTLSSAAIARRKLYVGGLPDYVVGHSQIYQPTAIFKDKIKLYLNFVSKAPFCVRGRPRPGPLNVKQILTFDVDGEGKHATMTPLVRPAGEPASWYVIIRGVSNPRGWNGVHLAGLSTVAGSMVIGPAKKTGVSVPLYVPSPKSTVALMVPFNNNLDRYDTNRIVSRKRGRPFGKSRGRRS